MPEARKNIGARDEARARHVRRPGREHVDSPGSCREALVRVVSIAVGALPRSATETGVVATDVQVTAVGEVDAEVGDRVARAALRPAHARRPVGPRVSVGKGSSVDRDGPAREVEQRLELDTAGQPPARVACGRARTVRVFERHRVRSLTALPHQPGHRIGHRVGRDDVHPDGRHVGGHGPPVPLVVGPCVARFRSSTTLGRHFDGSAAAPSGASGAARPTRLRTIRVDACTERAGFGADARRAAVARSAARALRITRAADLTRVAAARTVRSVTAVGQRRRGWKPRTRRRRRERDCGEEDAARDVHAASLSHRWRAAQAKRPLGVTPR